MKVLKTSSVYSLKGSTFDINYKAILQLQYKQSIIIAYKYTITLIIMIDMFLANNIIELMSKSLKLVVRNSKRQSIIQPSTARQSTPPISKRPSCTIDLSSKLNQLEGNLRMLQKRYRSNLKQGFDNKIKAYRLQAVVERKMLKQAIQQTQKAQQREHVKQRFEWSDGERRVDHSRAAVAHFQREQRIKYMKLRNIRQKRTNSLILYQRSSQIDRQAKQSHNRIVQQESLINKKKDYFHFLRQASLKKQQLQYKRQILNQIVSNTERLKDLKQTLQDLKRSNSDQEGTFITI